MLAEDYGDDTLVQEQDPNLDDDYLMLFERRKAAQPSQKFMGKYYKRKASYGHNDRTRYKPPPPKESPKPRPPSPEAPRQKPSSLSLAGDDVTEEMTGGDGRKYMFESHGPDSSMSIGRRDRSPDQIVGPGFMDNFPVGEDSDPGGALTSDDDDEEPSKEDSGSRRSGIPGVPSDAPSRRGDIPGKPDDTPRPRESAGKRGGILRPPPSAKKSGRDPKKPKKRKDKKEPKDQGGRSDFPPRPPPGGDKGRRTPSPTLPHLPTISEGRPSNDRGRSFDDHGFSSATYSSQESDLNKDIVSPGQIVDRPLSVDLVNRILDIFSADNLTKFVEVLWQVNHQGIEIEKFNLAPYLSSNTFFVNVLHYALSESAVTIAKYLIEKYPRELFLTNCEILDNVGKKRSKTCLHIIAERNLLPLANMIFEKMKDKEKASLMNRKGELNLGGKHYREVLWLHVACYYGHIDIVKFCLETTSPDISDSNGESGLFWAVKKDEVSIAGLLLNKKADVNLTNKSGTPPLYMAVRYSSIKCVKLIMEYNPDVSAKRGVGFETPLILACAFGYEDIVKTLVDAGADVAEPTSRGETAMHAAASEGWTTIMELLYKNPNGSDTVNAVSKTKETPLHYAVAKNQMDATQFLVERGADINMKDKHGKTVWNVAIESHKAPVLFTLLETIGPLSWEGEVSPLHLVAETPNSEEEFEVIKMSEMDMNTRDPENNTYLHTAAKYGNISVIKEGLGIISANRQNSSGNTPLHEAAKAGHLKAVKLLLRSCKLSILNESSESALHCAIKSPNASADVVREIVRHMKNTNSLDVLNLPNIAGNTALHLAAKYNRPEVVKYLREISPSLINNEGDNALHVAARRGNIEALKEVLKCFEYEMKINQKTEVGETLLHLVAKGGHVEMISTLIDYGINLAIQDDDGNTFLHDLAEQAGADAENNEMYNDLFDEVVTNSLKWWCKIRNLITVDEDSELSRQRRKDALLYLRSEIINNDGLTALQVAVKHGASSLVEKMIQVPLIFVRKSARTFTYDVTNLVPDTFVYKHKSGKKSGDLGHSDSQSDLDAKFGSPTETKIFINGLYMEPGAASEKKPSFSPLSKPVRASLLEVVVSKRPLNVANVMLDIEPLKQAADGYWMLYQLITSLLLVLHVVFMSVLSAYAVPEVRKALSAGANANINHSLANNGTSTEQPTSQPNPMFGFFLLWPLGILVQESYYMGNRIYRYVRRLDVSEPAFDEIRSDPKQAITVSDAVLTIFLYYMPHVINLIFSIMCIVWFQLYITGSRYHGILLAYVMLIGWLTTIAFTRTFRPMHAFTVMLRNIFIKDVLKFLFLYVFILLAFGFAFDCLAGLSPKVYSEFSSSSEVFYQTLGMLLEAGDVMVDDLEDKYKESGHNPFHYKFLYLLYALVTVVVLLNILIAMMNDSYSDIKSKEGVSFRVLSIQQAIHFEKALPMINKWFSQFRQQRHKVYKHEERWFMEIEIDELPKDHRQDDKHVILHTISAKLDKLNQQQNSMFNTIKTLRTRVDNLEQNKTIPGTQSPIQEQKSFPGNQTFVQPIVPEPSAPVYKPDLYESHRR